jgi:cytochrome c peroxidase
MITNSALAALICVPVFCLSSMMTGADSVSSPNKVAHEPIYPIPLRTETQNKEKLTLGRILFNDNRLTPESTHSCASCHHLESGGDDELRVSKPVGNLAPVVNTPTIFNTQYNFRLNWDGSAASVAEQLDMAIKRIGGYSSGWDELLARFNSDTSLVSRFNTVYKHEQITRESFTDALVTYLESLTTPNARFDKYLRGDNNAIDEDEKHGYTLFKEYGCISCHQGTNIGGNLYQRFGIFYDYFRARGDIQQADYGRMNVTGESTDMHVFKVPSLRNIELTAPYLHDGRSKSLHEVVTIMGRTQLGFEIEQDDIKLIVKFLKTLTGETSKITSVEQG